MELDIEPIFIEFDESRDGAAVAFVNSMNLHRRHLTPGQQAVIVALEQDWDRAQAVGKPKSRHVAELPSDSISNSIGH